MVSRVSEDHVLLSQLESVDTAIFEGIQWVNREVEKSQVMEKVVQIFSLEICMSSLLPDKETKTVFTSLMPMLNERDA